MKNQLQLESIMNINQLSPFNQSKASSSCSLTESLSYLSSVLNKNNKNTEISDFPGQLQQKFGISEEHSRLIDNPGQADNSQKIQLTMSFTHDNKADWELVSFNDVVSPPGNNNLSNVINQQNFSQDESRFEQALNDNHFMLRQKKIEQLRKMLLSEQNTPIQPFKQQQMKINPPQQIEINYKICEKNQFKKQLSQSKQLLKVSASKIDNSCLQSFRKLESCNKNIADILNSFLQLLNGLCLQITQFKIIGEIKNWKRLSSILGQSQFIISVVNKMDTIIDQNILPEANIRNAMLFYESSNQWGDHSNRTYEESKTVLIKQFIIRTIEYYYLNLQQGLQIEKTIEQRKQKVVPEKQQPFKEKLNEGQKKLKPATSRSITKIKCISKIKTERTLKQKNHSKSKSPQQTKNQVKDEDQRINEIHNKLCQWLSSEKENDLVNQYQSCQPFHKTKESNDYESMVKSLETLKIQKHLLRSEFL